MFTVAEFVNQCRTGALNGLAAVEAVGLGAGYVFKPLKERPVKEE